MNISIRTHPKAYKQNSRSSLKISPREVVGSNPLNSVTNHMDKDE